MLSRTIKSKRSIRALVAPAAVVCVQVNMASSVAIPANGNGQDPAPEVLDS